MSFNRFRASFFCVSLLGPLGPCYQLYSLFPGLQETLMPRGVGLMAYQYFSPGSDGRSWPSGRHSGEVGLILYQSGLTGSVASTCLNPYPTSPQAGTQTLGHLACVMSQPGAPRQAAHSHSQHLLPKASVSPTYAKQDRPAS